MGKIRLKKKIQGTAGQANSFKPRLWSVCVFIIIIYLHLLSVSLFTNSFWIRRVCGDHSYAFAQPLPLVLFANSRETIDPHFAWTEISQKTSTNKEMCSFGFARSAISSFLPPLFFSPVQRRCYFVCLVSPISRAYDLTEHFAIFEPRNSSIGEFIHFRNADRWILRL